MPTTTLRRAFQVIGIISGLLGALLLFDLWRASRPDAPATYQFGAEAMMAHGGTKYASQAAYLAESAPVTVLTLGFAAACFVGAVWLRRRQTFNR